MDNNNSLPYGTISQSNDTLPRQRHAWAPANSDPDIVDPVSVARNASLQSVSGDSHPGRNTTSWTRDGRSTAPSLYFSPDTSPAPQIARISPTQTCTSHSLINNQYLNNQVINTNRPIRGSERYQSNRFFQPSWSLNGVASAEIPNNNSYQLFDNTTSRSSASHLPSVTEQKLSQSVSYSNDTATRDFGDFESKRPSGIKRRVSRDDSDDGLARPASKLLLTEEKMAAKMHSLRISNDHSYPLNGLPINLMGSNGTATSAFTTMISSDDDDGQDDYDDDYEQKEDDNNNMESGDSAVYMLAPGVREALAKGGELLPQTLIDQMSKPCLAVIPWNPQDDIITKVSLNFHDNKTDDEKVAENEKYNFNKEASDNQSIIFTDCFDHTEVIDDSETFEFEDDDMDL